MNDFLNQGRVKKVYVQAGRRSVCCRITSTNGMYATPLDDGTAFCLLVYRMDLWFTATERYNGIPSMEILGEAAAGKRPVTP